MTDLEPSLTTFLDHAWQQLEGAVGDADHGFHWPVVATVDEVGEPRARVLVLRSADQRAGRFALYTDRRSPKVEEIERSGRAALTFHDAAQRLQVRARCHAQIEVEGAAASAEWAAAGIGSKRCYLAPHPPSSAAGAPSHNLPPGVVGRMMDASEVEPGRVNFAVIVCRAAEIDVLRLHPDGHTRALFRFGRAADGRVRVDDARWLNP